MTDLKHYTYAQAAARVHRSPRTIRKWVAAGMPMSWDQHGRRIVAHSILLAEYRKRCESDLQNNTAAKRAEREAAEADLRSLFGPVHERPPRQSAAVPPARPETPPPAGTLRPLKKSPQQPSAVAREDPGPTPMRPGPAAAWARLQAALVTTRPVCSGDDRFTSDRLSSGDTEQLTSVCSSCPVNALCVAYATEAKPAGGFWPTSTSAPALAAV